MKLNIRIPVFGGTFRGVFEGHYRREVVSWAGLYWSLTLQITDKYLNGAINSGRLDSVLIHSDLNDWTNFYVRVEMDSWLFTWGFNLLSNNCFQMHQQWKILRTMLPLVWEPFVHKTETPKFLSWASPQASTCFKWALHVKKTQLLFKWQTMQIILIG